MSERSSEPGAPLVEVEHLVKYFPIRKGLLRREAGATPEGAR